MIAGAVAALLALHRLAHGSQANGLALELGRVRRGELPRGDFVREEHIQLAVGTAFGLGETEEGPNDAEEVEAEPEEAGFWSPTPR